MLTEAAINPSQIAHEIAKVSATNDVTVLRRIRRSVRPGRATIDAAIGTSEQAKGVAVMERALGAQKTICLVAHDNKKEALSDWVAFNSDLLGMHHLVATGTTGTIIERRLGLPVRKLEADHGGDQRVGALIADGEIDFLVFFWDPLEPSRTTPTSRPCFASPSSGTSRSPVTAPRPTS